MLSASLRLTALVLTTSFALARDLPAEWQSFLENAGQVPAFEEPEEGDRLVIEDVAHFWSMGGLASMTPEACDLFLDREGIAERVAAFRAVARKLPELTPAEAKELRVWIAETGAGPVYAIRKLVEASARRHSLKGEFDQALDLYEDMVAVGVRFMQTGRTAGTWCYKVGRGQGIPKSLPHLFGSEMKLTDVQRIRLAKLVGRMNTSVRDIGLVMHSELRLVASEMEGEDRAWFLEAAGKLKGPLLKDPFKMADHLKALDEDIRKQSFRRNPLGLTRHYESALLTKTLMRCAHRGNECCLTGKDPGPEKWLGGELTSDKRGDRWNVDWRGDLMHIEVKLEWMTW